MKRQNSLIFIFWRVICIVEIIWTLIVWRLVMTKWCNVSYSLLSLFLYSNIFTKIFHSKSLLFCYFIRFLFTIVFIPLPNDLHTDLNLSMNCSVFQAIVVVPDIYRGRPWTSGSRDQVCGFDESLIHQVNLFDNYLNLTAIQHYFIRVLY